jgi:hypothetical protein
MMSNHPLTKKSDDETITSVSLELLPSNIAVNLPAGSIVLVANYGATRSHDLLIYVEGHVQNFGGNTIHVCLRVWIGNDFTSGTGTTNAGVRKARRFTDRAVIAESTDRMGPVLGHFEGAWVIGPGSSALWNAVEQFDASSRELLARMWFDKKLRGFLRQGQRGWSLLHCRPE